MAIVYHVFGVKLARELCLCVNLNTLKTQFKHNLNTMRTSFQHNLIKQNACCMFDVCCVALTGSLVLYIFVVFHTFAVCAVFFRPVCQTTKHYVLGNARVIDAALHRTAPRGTAPHRAAPRGTAPHRTAPPHATRRTPHRTAPRRTAPCCARTPRNQAQTCVQNTQ